MRSQFTTGRGGRARPRAAQSLGVLKASQADSAGSISVTRSTYNRRSEGRFVPGFFDQSDHWRPQVTLDCRYLAHVWPTHHIAVGAFRRASRRLQMAEQRVTFVAELVLPIRAGIVEIQIALCDSHGHGPNLSGDARTDWFSMHAPLFDAHPRGSERALAATRGA